MFFTDYRPLVPATRESGARIGAELSRKGIGSWKGGKPKGASRRVVVKGKPLSRIVIDDRR